MDLSGNQQAQDGVQAFVTRAVAHTTALLPTLGLAARVRPASTARGPDRRGWAAATGGNVAAQLHAAPVAWSSCYNRGMRLQGRDLEAGYGGQPVLHGATLDVSSGEFVGLIGPNGSGKSTLLRVLTRTIAPTSGSVLLDDRGLSELSAREVARNVAFVPQVEPTLFDFTVREVVLMGRHPYLARGEHEHDADYTAASRAMAATNTLHLAERPVTELSGGEHRRVLIARALAQNAPALLLDEPTAHLDITHETDLLDLLRRLAHKDGVAVLAALHDINTAAAYCDRIVLMAEGRNVGTGSPDAVLTSESLEQVYGVPVQVCRNPVSGAPMAVPAPTFNGPSSTSRGKIHVVCGGGTGLTTLSYLCRHGYEVTAGALNQMDTDEDAATALGIEHVSEAPYSSIGEQAVAACRTMMEEADAIVVTEVPFGNGNLANLSLTVDVAHEGRHVYLLGEDDPTSRDFTGGRATELLGELMAAGATRIPGPRELDAALRQISPSAQKGERLDAV